MYKQIDRREDERQNMPLRETVQPHCLRHTSTANTQRDLFARCMRDV